MDFVSNAPNGFRVSIHTFGYLPEDNTQYDSEFYFKVGTSVGFEATRWPWVNHWSETVTNSFLTMRYYTPIPLVIGEQPVGYVMNVDEDHDVYFTNSGSTISDGILSVNPGEIQAFGALFSPGTYYSQPRSPVTSFTYTLDQFGGFAVTSGGHRLLGFDGSDRILPSIPAGVYALISHDGLSVAGRMCATRGAGSSMCEAGVVLADGHRFVVEAMAAEGSPVLEVRLPSGGSERLLLDEEFGPSVHPLALQLDGGDEAEAFGIQSQLFASAFASNEEALQDAAIANYMGLGDLAHLDLDLDTTRITARVLLTTWAYEVTFVAVEEDATASLVLLSHRRVQNGGLHSEEGNKERVSVASEGHGLLGSTVATGAELPLEAFAMQDDSVLSTVFAHGLFQH